MGTLTQKLNYLAQTKENIRLAIQEKGALISEDAPFDSYPDKIREIETEPKGIVLEPIQAYIDQSSCVSTSKGNKVIINPIEGNLSMNQESELNVANIDTNGVITTERSSYDSIRTHLKVVACGDLYFVTALKNTPNDCFYEAGYYFAKTPEGTYKYVHDKGDYIEVPVYLFPQENTCIFARNYGFDGGVWLLQYKNGALTRRLIGSEIYPAISDYYKNGHSISYVGGYMDDDKIIIAFNYYSTFQVFSRSDYSQILYKSTEVNQVIAFTCYQNDIIFVTANGETGRMNISSGSVDRSAWSQKPSDFTAPRGYVQFMDGSYSFVVDQNDHIRVFKRIEVNNGYTYEEDVNATAFIGNDLGETTDLIILQQDDVNKRLLVQVGRDFYAYKLNQDGSFSKDIHPVSLIPDKPDKKIHYGFYNPYTNQATLAFSTPQTRDLIICETTASNESIEGYEYVVQPLKSEYLTPDSFIGTSSGELLSLNKENDGVVVEPVFA